MSHAKFTVSQQLKVGPGSGLFDFFAECVANFCKEQGVDVINPSKPVPMGFTFSFPVNQTALNGGMLLYCLYPAANHPTTAINHL